MSAKFCLCTNLLISHEEHLALGRAFGRSCRIRAVLKLKIATSLKDSRLSSGVGMVDCQCALGSQVPIAFAVES